MGQNGGKRRSILLAMLVGIGPTVLALGFGTGSVDAAQPAPTGYFVFGPTGFGASNCPVEGNTDTSFSAFVNQPVVGMAVTADCAGRWIATADGGVFTSANATFYGSAANFQLNQPIVGMAATSDDGGYWLVAADGGIFSFENAGFYGSMGGKALNAPIVGMAVDPATGGYWEVASDGGIFSFDAPFYGSMGGKALNAPIVGMAATPNGQGYWLRVTTKVTPGTAAAEATGTS